MKRTVRHPARFILALALALALALLVATNCLFYRATTMNKIPIGSLRSTKHLIPRRLIQIRMGDEKVPVLKEYILKYCKEPFCEYVFYDDDGINNYFETHSHPDFPEIHERYLSITKYEQRSDLFRFFYLYNEGGFWLDTDFVLHNEVEHILKNYTLVSAKVDPDPGYTTKTTIMLGLIATTKHHPFVLKGLELSYAAAADPTYDNMQILYDMYNHLTEANYYGVHLYKESVKHGRGYAGDYLLNDDGTVLADHYWKLEYRSMPDFAANRHHMPPIHNPM